MQDEGGQEEGLSSGDLPEGLQDTGGQVEERSEEEAPPRTSPPQVPPKHLPQLSSGDGECGVSSVHMCVCLWVNHAEKEEKTQGGVLLSSLNRFMVISYS